MWGMGVKVSTVAGSTIEPMRYAMLARHTPYRGAMDVRLVIGCVKLTFGEGRHIRPRKAYCSILSATLPIRSNTLGLGRSFNCIDEARKSARRGRLYIKVDELEHTMLAALV